MTDLNEMKMGELRSECKTLGIKTQNTDKKTDLIEKIQTHLSEELTETLKGSIGEGVKDPLVLKEGHVKEAVDEFVDKGVINLQDSPVYHSSPKTADGHDVEAVIDELNDLFAGRAVANYDREGNPNCIQFRGGPRVTQDVTIHQPKSSIFYFARTYCARADFVTGDLLEKKIKSLGLPDINTLTPAQKDEYKEFLKALASS